MSFTKIIDRYPGNKKDILYRFDTRMNGFVRHCEIKQNINTKKWMCALRCLGTFIETRCTFDTPEEAHQKAIEVTLLKARSLLRRAEGLECIDTSKVTDVYDFSTDD